MIIICVYKKQSKKNALTRFRYAHLLSYALVSFIVAVVGVPQFPVRFELKLEELVPEFALVALSEEKNNNDTNHIRDAETQRERETERRTHTRYTHSFAMGKMEIAL
jgi:hypothetical protein